jgi:hypothetical protein
MYSEMEGGLIITQKSINEAEEYRMNVDELNDAFTGFKITLGNQVIPAVNDLNTTLERATGMEKFMLFLYQVVPPLAALELKLLSEKYAMQDAVSATEEHGAALDGDTTSTIALGDATALTTQEINDMSKANNDHMSLIKKIDTIQKDYNESLASMTAEFGASSTQVKNLKADHQDAMNSIAYDLYVARLAVGGLSDEEVILAEKAGVAAGIFSQASVDMSYSLAETAEKAVNLGDTVQSSFMTAKESAMDATGGAVVFGGAIQSSFMTAKESARAAKSEAVAYGQAVAEASVDRTVTVTFNGVKTGDGWDPTYDVGHIGDGGRKLVTSAMASPYAAQQQPVIDYNLLATAIRDAIAPLIK